MEDGLVGVMSGQVAELLLQLDALQSLASCFLFRLAAPVDAFRIGTVCPPEVFAPLDDDFDLLHVLPIEIPMVHTGDLAEGREAAFVDAVKVADNDVDGGAATNI